MIRCGSDYLMKVREEVNNRAMDERRLDERFVIDFMMKNLGLSKEEAEDEYAFAVAHVRTMTQIEEVTEENSEQLSFMVLIWLDGMAMGKLRDFC